MPPVVLRRIGIGGVAGLALFAVAYWATREPAPRIRVLWRDGVSAQQRMALEARYALVNPRDRLSEGSFAYDLLDTSRSNIRRLVEDPAIADTNDIERHSYVIEPETDRGDQVTWVAYRIPGLRTPWARAALAALLVLAALVGLRREWLLLVRQAGRGVRCFLEAWNAHRRAPAESRDVFDAVPWRAAAACSSDRRRGLLLKLASVALLVAAAGPPVLETWEALTLAVAALALVFGDCRRGWWRFPLAAAVVVTAMGLKSALPRADIAEAHNAFLLPEDGGPLERGLPPEVFTSWKVQFDALYPKPAVIVSSSWRALNASPSSLYTNSTDAIWRHAKYTRQVDAIGFRSLAEFRGGFANEIDDNFYTGDMAREDMPFYVMYELTRASVGSRLRWTGQVFWERSDGHYDEIRHAQVGERTIEPHDAGRHVYAAFFPKREPTFEFQLVPSQRLRFAGWAEALLTLLGIGTVAILIRPRWPTFLRAATLFLIAYYVLIACYPEPSSARLGKPSLPHGGGNDGLVYEAQGRAMALLAGSGRIAEAMMGTEPVYTFTPGTRYVRMVEKLVFGETNHLFALLLAGVPIVVFYLLRHFIGALPAWVVTAVFLVIPIEHLSFLQYFTSGRAGYADWLGAGLFLLGLTLVLYQHPGDNGRTFTYVWAGGAALAAAMCTRPHVGLAAVWIVGVYLWRSWMRKDVLAALALAAGLAIGLWVPFHNWYYGGELNPLTKRGSTSLDRVSWQSFFRAPIHAAEGRLDTVAVSQVSSQFLGWLWEPWFAYMPEAPLRQWPERLLRMAALFVTWWIAFAALARRTRAPADLPMVAGAALWAHVAMFIVFGHHQRYLLAWDLSVVVLIVWLLARPSAKAPA